VTPEGSTQKTCAAIRCARRDNKTHVLYLIKEAQDLVVNGFNPKKKK
jgi:hypothetical protein